MTSEERTVLEEGVRTLTNFYEQDHSRILTASQIDEVVLGLRDNIQALIVLDRHERKVQ